VVSTVSFRRPAYAFIFLGIFATFTYGMFDDARHLSAVAFLVFTLLTVPVAALVVWTRGRYQRGFAAGLLLAWATLGIWVWMGAPGPEVA